MLRGMGLSEASERVYRALLDDPALDEVALAARLGLSPVQIGICFHELTELTLLRKSRADPGKSYPVPLERGIGLLLLRQEAELEARRKALQDGRAVAATVAESAAQRRSRIPAGVELVTGVDDIQNLLESLTQAAETEVLSIVSPMIPAEALEASRAADLELLARGIKVKMLCHESIRSDEVALAYEKEMVASGAHVRTTVSVPLRVLIIDRASAVLPFDPERMRDGAIMTTAPGMVRTLCELFDRQWEEATPLEGASAAEEGTGLTDAETELLKMLSGGVTDDAAAKRLGVSVRTVRRRMEALMRRLEAGSRFEAGYRAAKRGWL